MSAAEQPAPKPIADDAIQTAALRAGVALAILRAQYVAIASPLERSQDERHLFREAVRRATEALLDAEAALME